MRICTHIIINFLLFCLLYDVNSQLFDDVAEFTFDLYNEKINSTFFFNKDKSKTFKKIMQ